MGLLVCPLPLRLSIRYRFNSSEFVLCSRLPQQAYCFYPTQNPSNTMSEGATLDMFPCCKICTLELNTRSAPLCNDSRALKRPMYFGIFLPGARRRRVVLCRGEQRLLYFALFLSRAKPPPNVDSAVNRNLPRKLLLERFSTRTRCHTRVQGLTL